MRAVLQRVTHASVKVDGETIGEIGNGFLILLGGAEEDNEAAADKMADKICKLRIKAGSPEKANRLYEYFVERCRQYVPKVEHGSFGADMKVELLNDGPFTLMLEGDEKGIH